MSLITDIASLRATRFGQEISMLTEAGKDDPVRYISEFAKRKIEAFGGQEGLQKRKTAEKKRLKSSLNKAKPTKGEWIDFIESIKC